MEWVAAILIWLVAGVLFYLICLIVRWLCSRQNDYTPMGYKIDKRKESVPLNLQKLKDINSVGDVVCYPYFCGGRYFYEKNIDGWTECFHLSLTLPAYLYIRKQFKLSKKRKKQKAIN